MQDMVVQRDDTSCSFLRCANDERTTNLSENAHDVADVMMTRVVGEMTYVCIAHIHVFVLWTRRARSSNVSVSCDVM